MLLCALSSVLVSFGTATWVGCSKLYIDEVWHTMQSAADCCSMLHVKQCWLSSDRRQLARIRKSSEYSEKRRKKEGRNVNLSCCLNSFLIFVYNVNLSCCLNSFYLCI